MKKFEISLEGRTEEIRLNELNKSELEHMLEIALEFENYDNGRQGKPYQVKTDKGYSPIECYFKITKMEEKIKVRESMFGGSYEWVEIDNSKQKQT